MTSISTSGAGMQGFDNALLRARGAKTAAVGRVATALVEPASGKPSAAARVSTSLANGTATVDGARGGPPANGMVVGGGGATSAANGMQDDAADVIGDEGPGSSPANGWVALDRDVKDAVAVHGKGETAPVRSPAIDKGKEEAVQVDEQGDEVEGCAAAPAPGAMSKGCTKARSTPRGRSATWMMTDSS